MPENRKIYAIMRGVFLLAMAVLLTGCAAMPPALVYLGYFKTGADGISYLASHKSTTDHLVSSARHQDCAMHRVLWDEEICKDFERDAAMIASLKERALAAKPAAGPQHEVISQ